MALRGGAWNFIWYFPDAYEAHYLKKPRYLGRHR
jgi:hypothetical protein